MGDLNTRLARLEERIDNWMTSTVEYRREQTGKIDRIILEQDTIKKLVYELPCKERIHWYNGMNRQVKFMWVALSGMLLALLREVFFVK